MTHALALCPVFGEKFPRDRGGREGRTETGALQTQRPWGGESPWPKADRRGRVEAPRWKATTGTDNDRPKVQKKAKELGMESGASRDTVLRSQRAPGTQVPAVSRTAVGQGSANELRGLSITSLGPTVIG